MSLLRSFTEIPAVSVDLTSRKASVAWSKPVMRNNVPGTDSENPRLTFVYVLFTRDKNKKAGSAWKQVVQVGHFFLILGFSLKEYKAISDSLQNCIGLYIIRNC